MRNLHDQALRLLESPLGYPGLPDHPRVRVLLRVWRYPSFQPYASWTLAQAREEVFLRRITWDQRHPLADTPVTFGAEVVIQAQAYEPLLSTLRSIQLPPFIPANPAGIDGTTYGVELRDDVGSTGIAWWQTPPAEWAELGRWHSDAVAAFEALLPASTPSVRR